MKKKKRQGKSPGRAAINVIESQPFSEIIYLVAAGKNYGKVIADIRNKNPSPTIKQLRILMKRNYLFLEKVKLLNKRYYYVNWDKIIDEFLNLLTAQKNKIIQESEALHGAGWLKEHLSEDSFSNLQLLDNKDFIHKIKNNSYLRNFFEVSFQELSSLKGNFSILDFFKFMFNTNSPDLGLFALSIDLKEFSRNDGLKLDKKDEDNLNSLVTLEKIIWLCNQDFVLSEVYKNSMKKIMNEKLKIQFNQEEINKIMEKATINFDPKKAIAEQERARKDFDEHLNEIMNKDSA